MKHIITLITLCGWLSACQAVPLAVSATQALPTVSAPSSGVRPSVPPLSSPQPMLSPLPGPTASPPAVVLALPAPRGLRLLSLVRDKATLQWQPVAGAQAYRIYLDGRLLTSLRQDQLHYELVDLLANRLYQFEIRALGSQDREGAGSRLELRLPQEISYGGGGGGGGGASPEAASTSPVAALPSLSMDASFEPVPGPGHPVYLSARLSSGVNLPETAYSWSGSGGVFSRSNGARVIWTAPQGLQTDPQIFELRLTVQFDALTQLTAVKQLAVRNQLLPLTVIIESLPN